MTPIACALVVDDDDAIRDLLASVLKQAGFQVRLADGGEKALQMLSAWTPDVIFLDLQMPGVTGWEVIRRLEEHARPPAVVVLSGAHDELERLSRRPPVFGVLRKPFAMDSVVFMGHQAMALQRGDTEYLDRRREVTFPATLLGGAQDAPVLATVVNISLGGVRAEVATAFEPGERVEVALEPPGHAARLILAGEIRWHQGGSVGIQFRDVSADARRTLQTFIEPP